MNNFTSAHGFPSRHLLAAVVFVLTAALLGGWSSAEQAGQDRTQSTVPPGKGEADKKKPSGRKPKEEEEETTKPLRKVPLRVGDEDQEENQRPTAGKPGSIGPEELEREAKRAKHPAVRELFGQLAKPHDIITMSKLQVWNVEPLPEYVGPKSKPTKTLSLHPFTDAWKPRAPFSVSGNEVLGVEPYEQLALTKVEEFLKSGLDRDKESKQYLPRPEMLQEGEKVLKAVLLFHDSAVERGLRKGGGWKELREQLVAKLQEIQLSQLGALAEGKNWETAFELGSRLGESYPTQKEQGQIITQLGRFVHESFQEQNYGLARKQLFFLESQFPNNPALKPIRGEFHDQAAKLVEAAKALEKQGETTAAQERLKKAEEIYPQLPGLRDFDLRLNKKNPVLYIGVHDLPEYLSPATAFLDSEKQAVGLLFESLVKRTYSPKFGERYQACLARDLPKMVPMGRQFSLTPRAYWSDGRQVTAADIRDTVDLLSGSLPEWADFMQGGARVEEDSLTINLTLHRGYVDPLALMSFEILPRHHLNQVDDLKFAKDPVGSGPYQFRGREAGSAVFDVNPYYEMRAGKSGLPRIRHLQFVRAENPIAAFQEGHLHLLLDLPTSRFKELASGGLQGIVTFKTLPNRRIYFLAVNHQHPLLANVALRRALALAINREDILNQCFRAGVRPTPHRPLNGPYPYGSWACNPTLPADLCNPPLAKAQAEQAKDGRASVGKLTLKYPKDDPAVAKACEQIQAQIQKLGAGIQLELQPVDRRELHRAVEERRDYDLAYYSWDYPDETYWIWPLFDPRAIKPGGRNFLGYQNDGVLESLFHQVMSHRDPKEVATLTQRIHERFDEKMPFIPLWQLDTHLAIHNSLSMVDSHGLPIEPDPLLIFSSVETWTLNKR